MARVMLLGTGGTIASRALATGGVGATDGSSDLLSADDLRDLGAEGIEVDTVDVLSVNSFNLTFADLRSINDAVYAALTREDVAGVVLTHGTDTMEETVALLALTHEDDRPVVLTGAQRNADDADSDRRSNLLEAIAVAAAPQSRGRGVLVSFGGEVLAGVGVRKAHTTRPQPFTNSTQVLVGRACSDGVHFEQPASPDRRPRLETPKENFDRAQVDAVLTYPGGDARLFEAAIANGAQGVVLVCTGAGNPGKAFIPAIKRATDSGVLVAISTRTGDGLVEAIYGNGGAVDAVAAGAVLLGALPASQARVLMALLLSQGDAANAARQLREFVDITRARTSERPS